MRRRSKYPTWRLRKLRSVWLSMKYRCNDPENSSYGGRGITYSREWRSFSRFMEDVGEGYRYRLELDRIDNDKGYCKENCQWLTKPEHRSKTTADQRRKRATGLKARLRQLAVQQEARA